MIGENTSSGSPVYSAFPQLGQRAPVVPQPGSGHFQAAQGPPDTSQMLRPLLKQMGELTKNVSTLMEERAASMQQWTWNPYPLPQLHQ